MRVREANFKRPPPPRGRDRPGAPLNAPADTFTHACVDCGKTVRVVDGRSRWHWCRMPRRLRGKIGEAWAEGYRWGLADGRRRTPEPQAPPPPSPAVETARRW